MAQSAIDSSKIPVPDLMAGLLSVEAGWLKTDAANIRRHGSDIKTSWAGLSSCYSAPEAAQLFAAMDPVATVSDSFAGDVEKVVSILQTFAEEAGPLVSTLQKVQADASAFGSKISSNDKWDHDKSLVDENNGYIHTVNTAVVAFQAAERKAANGIEALVGGQQWHVITDPNDKSSSGFGYESIPDNAKTPWGADLEKKDGCLKETMKAGWHFAEGFGEGAWGAVKGIGALTGIEGWNAFKASWKGMENLALVVVPVAGVAVWGTKGYAQHATALGKGLTDWDEWKKNPAKALGNVTFSVLTVAVPGAGEAGAVGKAGEVAELSGDAAKASKASKLATAADVAKTGMQTFTKLTDPFHYAAQLPKVADFATGLELSSLPILTKFGAADRSGLTNASKTLTGEVKTAAATAEREPALVGGRSGGGAGGGTPEPPQSPAPTSGGPGGDNVSTAPISEASHATPMHVNSFPADEPIHRYADKIPHLPSHFDVGLHGTESFVEIAGPGGSRIRADAIELAKHIRSQPDYTGEAIRLVSCSTGAPEGTLAQHLANELNVEVLAPTDTLWIFSNGKTTIGPSQWDNTGTWQRFTPESAG